MRKAALIFMMFLLGLGLTQPSGFMHRIDLHEMYNRCSEEDHDITPLDFIFEHLLNLEAIVNIIEGEHNLPEGDQSHAPFEVAQTTVLVMSVPPTLSQFDLGKNYLFSLEKPVHFTSNSDFYMSQFFRDIFRPPIC